MPRPRASSSRFSASANTGTIAAARAKAGLLKLLDEVYRERKSVTITKRGRVVARLVPASDEPTGSLLEELMSHTAGLARTTGDLVAPDHDFWGPDWR